MDQGRDLALGPDPGYPLVLTPGIQLVLTTPTQLTGLSNAWALLLKIQPSIRLMDITQQPHYCAQQRFNKA